MHRFRNSSRKITSLPNGARRNSFQVGHVTIDIEEDFNFNGGTRIVERGSGYVRVVVLYEEELRWFVSICKRSYQWRGRKQQLGSIRGGARIVICSLILGGLGRMLEIRLFAPFGRRLIMIPELKEGEGWDFLADLLHCFLPRSSQQLSRPSHPPGPPLIPACQIGGFTGSRTYLQAAALPEWNAGTIRSSHNNKHVAINFEDAVESSHNLSRCLVGWFRGSESAKPDFSRVQTWVSNRWKFPGGVSVKELDDDRFLFIFPSKEIAIQTLNKEHFIDGSLLLLDVWQSWSCCTISERHLNSVWIMVVGLPIYLRNYNVFRSIGNYCCGFLGVEEGWCESSKYKWIRIHIKGDGRAVPASIPVAVGRINYDCPAWVERRPWMDWEEVTSINGVFQPSDGIQRAARAIEAEEGPSWRKVHVHGRQKDSAISPGDRRPTDKRKMVAREEVSGMASAAGRQTVTAFIRPQKPKSRNNISG